jgi:four helix bundle protein
MRDHTRLEAWQEARRVALAVTVAARDHWMPWKAPLVSQLQRAALSVQLNIAEGATFSRSPTYTRHLGIAYGSAVETCELLDLLTELDALPADSLEDLRRRAERTKALLLGLLKRHRPM